MIKSILTIATIFAATPVFAAAPSAGLAVAATPYGQFGCIQRAQNKLFSIGATSISNNGSSVWGFLNNQTTIGVWCRGPEAIISVSGENVNAIRQEIKDSF